jgi:hypothetical protein
LPSSAHDEGQVDHALSHDDVKINAHRHGSIVLVKDAPLAVSSIKDPDGVVVETARDPVGRKVVRDVYEGISYWFK